MSKPEAFRNPCPPNEHTYITPKNTYGMVKNFGPISFFSKQQKLIKEMDEKKNNPAYINKKRVGVPLEGSLLGLPYPGTGSSWAIMQEEFAFGR